MTQGLAAPHQPFAVDAPADDPPARAEPTATPQPRAPAGPMSRATAAARPAPSEIRPFRVGDGEAVARLFQRVFKHREGDPPRALVSYFEDLFLRLPGLDPARGSLVHVDAEGRTTGFVGVLPGRFRLDGRPVSASIVGSLMVGDPEADPLAGARLVRAVSRAGQDITLSETANPISQRMWETIGGVAVPGYSLDYLRPIRPVGLAVALAERVGPLRALRPVAALADRLAQSLVPAPVVDDKLHRERDLSAAEAAELVVALTEDRRFRPDWAAMPLDAMLATALDKAAAGEPLLRGVFDARGRPVGLYLIHARRGEIATALQVLSRPKHEVEVAARMVAAAASAGAVALHGRIEPAMADALSRTPSLLVHRASLIVHAADRALIEPIRSGDALVTGLAGETWIRLIGGSFS
jgi:hypothetical protein